MNVDSEDEVNKRIYEESMHPDGLRKSAKFSVREDHDQESGALNKSIEQRTREYEKKNSAKPAQLSENSIFNVIKIIGALAIIVLMFIVMFLM